MSRDPIPPPRSGARFPALAAATLLALLATGAPGRAQEGAYAVGDRVQVDVGMASDPAYQSWVSGTITGIQMWQGQVSGIFVRTDDGREVTSAARFMRPGAEAPAPTPASAPAGGSPASAPTPVPTAPTSTPTAAAGAAGGGASAATRPSGGTATAAADRGTGNCRVGTRVTDRDGKSGTVVRATGASCYVDLDGVDEEGYYLQWMLRPEGQAPAADGGGALETGSYTCWTANGVAGVLRLVILSGTTYADGNGNRGTYTHDAASGRIEWTSGPWGGFYGTKLAPGKIGISSRPGGFSNTTCDRK